MAIIVNHSVDGETQSAEVEISIDGIPIEEMPPIQPDSRFSFYIDGLLEASMVGIAFTNLSQTRTDEEIRFLVEAAFEAAKD